MMDYALLASRIRFNRELGKRTENWVVSQFEI